VRASPRAGAQSGRSRGSKFNDGAAQTARDLPLRAAGSSRGPGAVDAGTYPPLKSPPPLGLGAACASVERCASVLSIHSAPAPSVPPTEQRAPHPSKSHRWPFSFKFNTREDQRESALITKRPGRAGKACQCPISMKPVSDPSTALSLSSQKLQVKSFDIMVSR
jgi:hypothetical protein